MIVSNAQRETAIVIRCTGDTVVFVRFKAGKLGCERATETMFREQWKEVHAPLEKTLDQFFTRAGRAIGVLLGSNAWDTVAARAVNPDGMVIDDGKLRWLNTLSVATAGVNKPALIERAIHLKQAQLLQLMAKRLSASINSNS